MTQTDIIWFGQFDNANNLVGLICRIFKPNLLVGLCNDHQTGQTEPYTPLLLGESILILHNSQSWFNSTKMLEFYNVHISCSRWCSPSSMIIEFELDQLEELAYHINANGALCTRHKITMAFQTQRAWCNHRPSHINAAHKCS